LVLVAEVVVVGSARVKDSETG
jgi:hypothetical protein